eukprot:32487_1
MDELSSATQKLQIRYKLIISYQTSCLFHTYQLCLLCGRNETDIGISSNSPLVNIDNLCCTTNSAKWVSVSGNIGIEPNTKMCTKIYYEAFISNVKSKWSPQNFIGGGLCRFGYGTLKSVLCGTDAESFGYGGTGKYSYNNKYFNFGQSFEKNDTITAALDFNKNRIYFAKNGVLFEKFHNIPEYLLNKKLFPMVACKNITFTLNFTEPKKPCDWLIKKGFKTFEEIFFNKKKYTQSENKESSNDNDDCVHDENDSKN